MTSGFSRCVLVVLAYAVHIVCASAADRPNILLIYTDDQGSVDLGCYGSTDIETPHVDELAASGVRFTQMLAPSAICSASRAGLLTGRIPPRAGVPANVSSIRGNPGLPESEFTMAEMLGKAGYRTGHVGKWHLGYSPETMPNAQGFGHSFGHMGGCIDNYSHFFYWRGPNQHDLWRNGEEVWRDGEYFGDLMVEEVKNFVDGAAGEDEAPFFLYWAINWPHYPLQASAKWREKYRDLSHPRDKYAAFVSTTDELIGEAVAHLEEKGLRENTLVLVQSDHGHSVEERTFGGGGSAGPYRGHKGTLLEGGLRVPSVVSWPAAFPRGEVRDQMVHGTDWFPTFAEIAGAELPEDLLLDGRSLVSVIENGEAPAPRGERYWRLGGNPDKAKWAVREGNWKLLGKVSEQVRPAGVPEFTAEDRELFLANLAEDIGETENLAKEHPEVVERLLEIRERYEEGLEE